MPQPGWVFWLTCRTGGSPALGCAPAGPVVEVRMTGTVTAPVFEPASLTIAPGTTLRFINVSAGPHNVAFWGDSIPAGAAAVLNAAMAGRTMGDLSGMMVTQPNETFDIAYGVGRYEDFGGPFRADDKAARPFILNQPIYRQDRDQFSTKFNLALTRTAPGAGNDLAGTENAESIVEALYPEGSVEVK